MELLIASRNIHKIREFKAILKGSPFLDVVSLLDFPKYVPPPETGASFEENATLKAVHAAKTLGKLVLADDSGIVVPALDGRPGVYSARFAGEKASDRDNRAKLMEEMGSLRGSARSAYYECCVVIASPEGPLKTVHGFCEGEIIEEERGQNGFGYDPLFMKYDYSKTLAELPDETKNKISHRYKAVEKVLPFLESLSNKISNSCTSS